MNTSESMNASLAIGLAQTPTKSTLVTKPAVRRKILVRGLLVVASCSAIGLILKTAMMINDVLAYLNKTYDSFCT